MKKELVQIQKLKNGKIINMTDETATEVRFEVKTWGREGFAMSCTPENLEELVIGILFSKGYIESAEQVERVEVSYENFEIHAVLTDRRFPGFGKKEKEAFEVPDVAELFRTAEEILGNPGELFQTRAVPTAVRWLWTEE